MSDNSRISVFRMDWIRMRETRGGNTSFRPSLLAFIHSLKKSLVGVSITCQALFWALQI